MPWTPADIDGLDTWLDASQLALVGGDPVTTWPDSSGNSNDGAIVGTPEPQYKVNRINSLPAVLFIAGEGRVRGTFGLVKDYTVCYVARMVGPTYARIFNSVYPEGGNWLLGWWNGTMDSMYAGSFAQTGPASDTSWQMYGATGITAGGYAVDFYKMGAYVASVPSPTDGFGGRYGLSGYALTGIEETSDCYVAEVVAYDLKLADADREAVEGYLAHKYGLEASLPALHPYKAAPPGSEDGGLVKIFPGGVTKPTRVFPGGIQKPVKFKNESEEWLL